MNGLPVMQAWNDVLHPPHRYSDPPHAQPVLEMGRHRTLHGGGWGRPALATSGTATTVAKTARAPRDARAKNPRRVSAGVR